MSPSVSTANEWHARIVDWGNRIPGDNLGANGLAMIALRRATREEPLSDIPATLALRLNRPPITSAQTIEHNKRIMAWDEQSKSFVEAK